MDIQAVQGTRQSRLRFPDQPFAKTSCHWNAWMPPAGGRAKWRRMFCQLAIWLFGAVLCDAQEATVIPNDDVKDLVGIYMRDVDDKAWGLLDIVKAEKGRSYVSQGEHGIRAGIEIDPTRVTLTGWGFVEGSKPWYASTLGHFQVVCTWFCYKNDFGEAVALPDQHNLTALKASVTKGKNIPDLGELGMSPQQMEQACGAPVEPPGPDTKYAHVTRIHFRKAGYDLSCLFYEDKMFSTTFWCSDNTPATATDKLAWLLQNGVQWKCWRNAAPNERGEIPSYARTDDRLTGRTRWLKTDKGVRYDVLEVRDTKIHPGDSYDGEATAPGYHPITKAPSPSPDSPLGRYQRAIEKAVSLSWYDGLERNMSSMVFNKTVRVHFTVDASGRVSDVKLIEGDADSVLAGVALAAVKEAKMPPVPKDVVAALRDKPMELEYNFSVKQ